MIETQLYMSGSVVPSLAYKPHRRIEEERVPENIIYLN